MDEYPRVWSYIPMPHVPPEGDRSFKDRTHRSESKEFERWRMEMKQYQKRQYDLFAERMEPGEWMWTQDDDCYHCDPRWHSQLRIAIKEHGPIDVYIPYVNRGAWGKNIPREYPEWPGMWTNELNQHVAFGEFLAEKNWGQVEDITDDPGHPGRITDGRNRNLEGPCFCFSKEFVEKTGPIANWRTVMEGSLWRALKNAGSRLYLLKGVYVFHMCSFLMPQQQGEFTMFQKDRERKLAEQGHIARIPDFPEEFDQ